MEQTNDLLFENDALDDAITVYGRYSHLLSLTDRLALDDETVIVVRLGSFFRGICEVRSASDCLRRSLRLLEPLCIIDDLCNQVRWEEASARQCFDVH